LGSERVTRPITINILVATSLPRDQNHERETVSNVGYHGDGEFRRIPREEWGVGMAEIDIVTDLCPGGRLRIERLLNLLELSKVDPTKMTTHEFDFDDIEQAFEMMETKKDGMIKPLIHFYGLSLRVLSDASR
jgi:threonine dehydrogenase-like Zn-dependent dehydrogenase